MVALGFILTVHRHDTWLLYVLSGLLMLASPFFTSGRAAILPAIATKEELHTANSLTQTTQWTTLTLGAFLGGASVAQFGYHWAFVGNALSFLISALCISRLFLPGRGFRRRARALTEAEVVRPWHEYVEGLRYMRCRPLIFGYRHDRRRLGHRRRRGADPVQHFRRNGVQSRPGRVSALIWGCAGIGLLCGGAVAYSVRPRAELCRTTSAPSWSATSFTAASYILFSQMRSLRLGAGLHRAVARGRGRQFHLEYVAAAAARVPTPSAGACSPPSNPCSGR